MALKDILGGTLRAFNRRYEHSKISNKTHRVNGSVVIFITSRLQIKREINAVHVVARKYRRATRGLCGAWTWKDLDRMSRGTRLLTGPAQQRLAKMEERRTARAARSFSLMPA